MSYCLNPQCPSPQNPPGMNYCQTCGTSLLLRGHYRAVRPLGRGGMGRTFLAVDEDTPSKRNCVIKQFCPAPDILNNPAAFQKSLELFKREAETLDRLGDQSHQIPHLLAYLEREQQFYLVQEFIDGENLLEHLSHRDGYSEAEVRQLLQSLLPVLDFVHRQEVIHRDIKPENIMRCQNGRIVLIDFGISKQLDQTMLRPGTRGGTQGYAPLEQLVYGAAYPSSDLYALGTTCIHLLTKRPPHDLFDHFKKQWIWRSVLQTQGRTVSPALGEVLDKLLQEDYQQRYPSAMAVMAALEPPPTIIARSPVASPISSASASSPSAPSPSSSPSHSDTTVSPLVSQPTRPSGSGSKQLFRNIGIGLIVSVLGLGIVQISNSSRSTDPRFEPIDPLVSATTPSASPLSVAALIEQGDQFSQAEQWAEAIDAYTQAIELDPNNADTYYNRGLAYHNQGDSQAALADYSEAIELDPNYSFAYNNRGNIHYDQGDLQAALGDYNRAIETDFNNAIAHYNRGNVYRNQDNLQTAISNYTQAIELDPDYADAYFERGLAYHDQRNLPAALADYTQVIALDPNYTVAYYNRGNIHYDQGNLPAAIADYNRVIDLDANYIDAYNNRGLTYRNQGNLPAALADYNQAIELDSNYAHAYFNRGLLFEQLNQRQNAILDLQRAASLYDQQGDADSAQDALAEVQRLQQ
ncbi:tetratricopeptide repeat protein [Egbenema bharatensis]|uniref:tetratricopeptide repeat protein n=1 Tax=Egbenema bharatensis TaxID=3463334 RepID=UPI003A84D905